MQNGRSRCVGIRVGLKLCCQEETIQERYRDVFAFRSDDTDIKRRDQSLEPLIASNQRRLADYVGCLRDVRECWVCSRL